MGCTMPLIDKSKLLTTLSKSILLILLAIELKFVETNNLGMALKLLKIRKLTEDHFNTNGDLREKLMDWVHFYRADLLKRLSSLVTSELSLLQSSKAEISKIYKKIFKTWAMPNQEEIKNYISSVKSQHKDTILYLNRQYKLNSSAREFNSVVYNVGFRALSESEEQLIKNICVHTTYTFTNKARRIDYSSFAKHYKFS